jgi:protein SCO1
MFCPYPSVFDNPAHAKCVQGKSSSPSWTLAITVGRRFPRQSAPRYTIRSAKGLKCSKTWQRISRVVLTFAASSAVLITSALAGDFQRAADHDYDAPVPGSYTLPIVKPAADGDVLDSQSRPLRLRELTHGRITVMSFIYTRCAAVKACPYATGVLMNLHRLSADDAALAKEMRLVSMSFDPANDTPERMAGYATLAAACPTAASWQFITTHSQKELQLILDAYGQAVDKKKNQFDPAGPLNHTLRVFLIDRDGNIRNIYSTGTLDVRLVLADVRTLMMESTFLTSTPLTPEQAARQPGKTCTVAFKVQTAARVTDITERESQRPLEVLLADARNDDVHASPVERAGIIVRIPVTALEKFGAHNLDELARRFEGKSVAVTGKVEVEPHPFRHDNRGAKLSRPNIIVTEPAQIQIETER